MNRIIQTNGSRHAVESEAQLPPHDEQSEAALLGCVLQCPSECIDDCEHIGVTPDWFFIIKYREIFIACKKLRNDASVAESGAFKMRVKDAVAGLSLMDLVEIENKCPSASMVAHFAGLVREKYTQRFIIQTCANLSEMASAKEPDIDALISAHEKASIQLCDSYVSSSASSLSRIIDTKQAARDCTDDVEKRFNLCKLEKLSGLSTGFVDLDLMTDGLQLGEMAVIGARPSQGKTSIAVSIAHHVAVKCRVPTAFVTLEMRHASILRRMVSVDTNIEAKALRTGNISEHHMPKFSIAISKFSASPLHFINGIRGMTSDQVDASVRHLIRKFGIKLVIVDYLQKIKPARRSESRVNEVSAVSEAMKSLADSTGTAVLCLAQLKRDADKETARLPRMSDLSDSSQIEKDADMIGLIYRPVTESDPMGCDAQLVIAKQRDGETGSVHLVFIPTFARFESASKIDVDSRWTKPQTNDP